MTKSITFGIGLVFSLLLLFPLVAGSWTRQCEGGDFSTILLDTGSTCYSSNDTTDSGWAEVGSECQFLSFYWDPDTSGSGTGAEAYVRVSSSNAGACSAAEILSIDLTGDGLDVSDVVTLDGSLSRRAMGAVPRYSKFFCVDVTANPSSHTFQMEASCLK